MVVMNEIKKPNEAENARREFIALETAYKSSSAKLLTFIEEIKAIKMEINLLQEESKKQEKSFNSKKSEVIESVKKNEDAIRTKYEEYKLADEAKKKQLKNEMEVLVKDNKKKIDELEAFKRNAEAKLKESNNKYECMLEKKQAELVKLQLEMGRIRSDLEIARSKLDKYERLARIQEQVFIQSQEIGKKEEPKPIKKAATKPNNDVAAKVLKETSKKPKSEASIFGSFSSWISGKDGKDHKKIVDQMPAKQDEETAASAEKYLVSKD